MSGIRPSGLRRAAILLVLRAAVAAAAEVHAPEYEVKAAFLYNFAKFVEWPDEATGRFVAVASDVEVLEPARLRDEMLAVARAAVDRYSRP